MPVFKIPVVKKDILYIEANTLADAVIKVNEDIEDNKNISIDYSSELWKNKLLLD